MIMYMLTSLLYQLYVILVSYLSDIIMPKDLNFNTSALISIELIQENSVLTIIGTTFLCLLALNPRNTLFRYYYAQY